MIKEHSPEAAKEYSDCYLPSYSFLPEFSTLAQEIIEGFSKSIYMHGLGVNPDEENPRVPQIVWAAIAYTIKAHEEIQRNENRSLFARLTTRVQEAFSALVNFASYIPITYNKNEVRMNSHPNK